MSRKPAATSHTVRLGKGPRQDVDPLFPGGQYRNHQEPGLSDQYPAVALELKWKRFFSDLNVADNSKYGYEDQNPDHELLAPEA